MAAVPDPALLTIMALERLSEQVRVDILINAPESMEDHFDRWGRPDPEKWRSAAIDIPDAPLRVILAGSPASQSLKVLETIAAHSNSFGPKDIAIGVPDRTVIPFLLTDLATQGLAAFDPADKSLKEHPLFALLEALRTLLTEGTYTAFSTFLRHPDVLRLLEAKRGLSPFRILKEMDEFQNFYLPAAFEDVARRFNGGQHPVKNKNGNFAHLAQSVTFVREQLDAFVRDPLAAAVRSLLQTVYDVHNTNGGDPGNDELKKAAEKVDESLREFTAGFTDTLGTSKGRVLDLLLRRLSEQNYHREHEESVIDLEGWLELSWNDAPFLIVTGMNEDIVPDGRVDDIFLPDSMRQHLNLRHGGNRLARDAFLMRGLIESRRKRGPVYFIAGKTTTAGDPVKPSRLLFRCRDEELPERAGQLFGPIREKRQNHPATISFMLDPASPDDVPPEQMSLREIFVTSFRDYLACPFRFYLKHVLQMEELDDGKRGMDAFDFGNMVHAALRRMADIPEMRECDDAGRIGVFLAKKAQEWVAVRFGAIPPLPVTAALDAATQRLHAAAHVQVGLVDEGWEMVDSEKTIETELAGMRIRGKIDRIDRHRKSGRFRIIDYKTSDNETTPEKAHLAPVTPATPDFAGITISGAARRWIDLQLPLYKTLLTGKDSLDGQIELAYFNLPKAISHTSLAVWENFTDDLLLSAEQCATGIIRRLLRRCFWPPSEKVKYDDFKSLFYPDVQSSVNKESFDALMSKSKTGNEGPGVKWKAGRP